MWIHTSTADPIPKNQDVSLDLEIDEILKIVWHTREISDPAMINPIHTPPSINQFSSGLMFDSCGVVCLLLKAHVR